MRCDEMNELASSYLSEGLEAARRREFDDHLAGCPACVSLLEQQLRADDLLRSSLTMSPVRAAVVQNHVRARLHAAPWWRHVFQARGLQVAVASVLIVIATISFVRSRPAGGAAYLLETAAADHVEDVVQRVDKPGWVGDARKAERLAVQIVGDARPIGALAPAGYELVRARPCQLEGRAEAWLHLIYAQGAREVSVFVRSSRLTPGSKGQLALRAGLSTQRVGDLEVVGFQRGAYGIVFVADLSPSEALRVARAAADRIS